jgi:hypothetical protein
MSDNDQEVFSIRAEKKKIISESKKARRSGKPSLKDYIIFIVVMMFFAWFMQKCRGE